MEEQFIDWCCSLNGDEVVFFTLAQILHWGTDRDLFRSPSSPREKRSGANPNPIVSVFTQFAVFDFSFLSKQFSCSVFAIYMCVLRAQVAATGKEISGRSTC